MYNNPKKEGITFLITHSDTLWCKIHVYDMGVRKRHLRVWQRDENRWIKTEYSLYLQINLNILNLKT